MAVTLPLAPVKGSRSDPATRSRPGRRPTSSAGHRRRSSLVVYFVALVVVGLMLAPVAYIILGGFRSNS